MKTFTVFDNTVYRAQCKTWERAMKLCGIAGSGPLATCGNHPLATFRAKPQYRDAYAKTLRGMVALSIRMDRFQNRNVV